MDMWGWLIGYAVLFAILHLVLYYAYVRRDGGTGTGYFSSSGDGDHPTLQSSPRIDGYQTYQGGDEREGLEADEPDSGEADPHFEADGETTDCPHCGSPNEADPTYTYCRICISPLRY